MNTPVDVMNNLTYIFVMVTVVFVLAERIVARRWYPCKSVFSSLHSPFIAASYTLPLIISEVNVVPAKGSMFHNVSNINTTYQMVRTLFVEGVCYE